jgi:Protein of unknown function (DUF2723)
VSLAPPARSAPSARFAPSLAGAIALLVYARTLMPGIAFGDWGEMQTISHVLGVAHPTGYPTYVILAWFAQLVPLGSIAVRLNFLSALCVAGTVATTSAIAIRLGVRPLIAIAAALALGAVGTVWAAATVAEVNPLHLLFAALILHRALVWSDGRATRDLVLGGLLIGLALGNHLLTLFIAPFAVLFVLWSGRRELLARPWLIGAAGLAGLAGLAVYLYIPIAASLSPPLPYNHPTTLDGVLWLVSGTQFRGQFDFLSARGPGDFIASLPTLWSIAVSRATPVLPILGAAGLAILALRRPAFGLLCVTILVFGLYVWANYLELEHYLLVPWLIVAIGAAVALETVARVVETIGATIGARIGRTGRLARADAVPADHLADLPADGPTTGRAAGRTATAMATGVGLAGLAFAIVLATMNFAASDRSADLSGDTYVDAVFAALPKDAAILSYWDASTPLWHGSYVEGLRPDVLIVDDTNIVYEGWGTRETRIESLICERPVFILRPSEQELAPTRVEFDLVPFMMVRVALGGPSAAVDLPIYQVKPLKPCV